MSFEIVPHSDSDDQFQVFSFNGIPVRGKLNESGEPEIIASDVCAALDIKNIRQNLAKLDDDEKGVCTVYTPGGQQTVATVTESGVYALILTSRKPEAKKLKRWLTHEVLPALRKTGVYLSPAAQPSTLDIVEGMVRVLRELQEQQAQTALAIEDIHEVLLDRDYYTVLQWCQQQRIRNTVSLRIMWGKEATALSTSRNIEIKSANEGPYNVGRYHKSILQAVCIVKPRSNGQLRLMDGGK